MVAEPLEAGMGLLGARGSFGEEQRCHSGPTSSRIRGRSPYTSSVEIWWKRKPPCVPRPTVPVGASRFQQHVGADDVGFR